ncbi:MAG: hypothetical protein KAS92_03190, partial [Candidatus Omnitrophica bacterium]|nr:hypothetical protein [Candidatus Omnitrophota bacterium]
MGSLLIVLAVCFLGMGVALFLVFREEDAVKSKSRSPLKDVLASFTKEKKSPQAQPAEEESTEEPEKKLSALIEIHADPPSEPLTPEESKALEEEIHVSLQLGELQEKYTDLQKRFDENQAKLERHEKTLTAEIKKRKEFNQVKNQLEKEVRDTKDKFHEIELKRDDAVREMESWKRRADQLEEKVNKRQKEVLEKENEVDKARKEFQEEKKRSEMLMGQLNDKEALIKEKDQQLGILAQKLKEGGMAPSEEEAKTTEVASAPAEAPAEATAEAPAEATKVVSASDGAGPVRKQVMEEVEEPSVVIGAPVEEEAKAMEASEGAPVEASEEQAPAPAPAEMDAQEDAKLKDTRNIGIIAH